MYLKQTKRSGRIYLSVMQNYRSQGKVHAKTVERIGYADEFADRFPDPIAHFKAYVADLNDQAKNRNSPVRLSIPRNAMIGEGSEGSIQLGAAIALGYLDALGLGRFYSKLAGEHAETSHPAGGRLAGGRLAGGHPAEGHLADGTNHPDENLGRAFELLASARMLHAVPVHETWSARAKFPRTCNMDVADIFRGLELIASSDEALVRKLNARYEAIHGKRHLDNVRLVFSNYAVAWPGDGSTRGPDELEKHVSTRLCLVIDEEGIPLTYRFVPRRMSAERTLAIIDELKTESAARHVTVVAAQLSEAAKVVPQLAARNDGFVLLMHTSETTIDQYRWAADESEYRPTRNQTYRIKSRRADFAIPDRHAPAFGQDAQAGHTIKVKEIALRSMRANANQSFFIVSNETTASNAAIFNIYRELWRVHEPFQVISADFIAPPYPIDTQVHLRAHFAICYAAFFALRMLRQDMGWKWNAAQVADALVHMEGAYLDENWYLFNYRSAVSDDIQQAMGTDAGRRLMNRADIRNVVAQARKRAEHLG